VEKANGDDNIIGSLELRRDKVMKSTHVGNYNFRDASLRIGGVRNTPEKGQEMLEFKAALRGGSATSLAEGCY
jgi:hypothetical protein